MSVSCGQIVGVDDDGQSSSMNMWAAGIVPIVGQKAVNGRFPKSMSTEGVRPELLKLDLYHLNRIAISTKIAIAMRGKLMKVMRGRGVN